MPVATIARYQTASGAELYMVRYRKPDNKQTTRRGFSPKRDAQMFAATVEVARAKGEYVAPKLGRITVGGLSAALRGQRHRNGAGGGTRTLMLFRAPAPKAGA